MKKVYLVYYADEYIDSKQYKEGYSIESVNIESKNKIPLTKNKKGDKI